MSDGERLVEVGSDLERALLRAGAEEAPGPASVRRAAQMLGLVPLTAVVSTGVASWMKALKISWFVPLVVPVAVTGLGLGVVGRARHLWPRPPAPIAFSRATSAAVDDASRAIAPARAQAGGAEPASAGASSPVVSGIAGGDEHPSSAGHDRGAEAAQSGAVSPAASLLRAGTSSSSLVDVSRQLAVIDKARARAAAGDHAAALRALDDYDRRFVGGVFAEEAALIRIESVSAAGDRAAAETLARRFLARYPESIHADVVASILRHDPR